MIGPFAAASVFLSLQGHGWNQEACWAGAVATICAFWWIFEPIPIPATSLIPIGLLPLFGVLTPKEIGQSYGSPMVLLLLGGFILSTAMAKSGAHLRVAVTMINLFGGQSSKKLVYGFMAAAAILSMWISNTATTLMLLPVALATIERSDDKKLAAPLLLGIAYAASIGGIGTPIGTPPNLVFREIYQQNTGVEVGFFTWMSWGIPVVAILIPIAGLWITRNLGYLGRVSVPEISAWNSEEKRVFTVFFLTAMAWVSRSQPFGGWQSWLNLPNANDASVALVAVVAMFLIPNGKGGKLLDWSTASDIPWGMLLLFGGGIAIANSFVSSGLSASLGQSLAYISTWHLFLLILAICLLITFLTEMTSNLATTTLILPILAAMSLSSNISLEALMVPAAMSASCAFMLPVATAPNTIVFSTSKFPLALMATEGLLLNLVGAMIIASICALLFD
ncbi:MAG: SLC13 family permease [Candidatus Azotimanducaceae bacterium]